MTQTLRDRSVPSRQLTQELKNVAVREGVDLAGVCSVESYLV